MVLYTKLAMVTLGSFSIKFYEPQMARFLKVCVVIQDEINNYLMRVYWIGSAIQIL